MRAKQTIFGLVYVLILSFTGFRVEAQNLRHIYKLAEGEFYLENPHEALILYQDIINVSPEYEDVRYKVELCILLQGNGERPLDDILEFRDTRGRRDKFYYYWLGKILDYRYQFEEAILAWGQFLKIDGYKSPEIVQETRSFIENARKKIEIFERKNDFQVVKLGGGVNSAEAELTPTFIASANELLFASARADAEGNLFKIFRIKRLNNEWNSPVEVPAFGDFNMNTANLVLVNEDGKLFMYQDHKGGDLYFSELANGKWSSLKEFDSKISNTHLGSHFYINEHEDRIIFSTDKHYKKQGLDLYQSYKDAESGKWSKPSPFSEVINTEYDEDSPYLSQDEKTLYFSSKGHNSIGGFDVFKSEFDQNTLTWTAPVNLNYPINTPDDEIQFKISLEGDQGFLSSNRLKLAHDYDIYHFYKAEWTQIEGKIYDFITKAPVNGGEIKFLSYGLEDEQFLSKIDSSGKYETEVISDRNYGIEISKNGSVVYSDEFEVQETEDPTLHIKNFYINGDLIEEESQASLKERIGGDDPNRYKEFEGPSSELTKLGTKYRTAQKAILNNIYFDFGTSALKPESNEVLKELFLMMKNNANIRIEIAGHTDSVGPSDANLWLSENRAKAVRNFLTELGISSNRMLAKGYGESRPFATNDNEQDGRELNRRIEVLVK